MDLKETEGYEIITKWLHKKEMRAFDFQEKTWDRYSKGYSGLLVAPTGFGKTYAAFIAVVIDYLNSPEKFKKGLKLIWITPLKSLSKDLARAMQEAIDEIGLDWRIEVRNGDTDPKTKQRQSRNMPDVLLLTPESLHLLLAQKNHLLFFKNLKAMVVDEWHELLGTKRGVLVELATGYLKSNFKRLKTWGITATIGNLNDAMEVLLTHQSKKTKIIAKEKKKIEISPVYPEEVELLPWAGHLGGNLASKVAEIILKSGSVIIFTNTRNQSEMWYQLLLDVHPDFAGQIALHHSSIDSKIREWIEEALGEGRLKAVVATSSLDLGIDFKPVDTIIQIGSPKGIARFMQRAGRSGHSPNETSKIYFVPTHSLELIEIAAMKQAIKTKSLETREPLFLTYDVLVQFLITLAIGGGFREEQARSFLKKTHAFANMEDSEWNWCIAFITYGGPIGKNYEEFHKVTRQENGIFLIKDGKTAMLHRMNIGVIVSESMLRVKFVSGGYIGMVEEYFISKLKPGSKFILAGRILELVRIREMTVQVKSSTGKAITPSWLGGRLPLTSNLSHYVREKLAETNRPNLRDPELRFLKPMLDFQQHLSQIPNTDEFLVENIKTKAGSHLFVYPFEGRLIHEVMAALLAYRISRIFPISFSMAMNDYGFELFSDSEIPLSNSQVINLFSKNQLMEDVLSSINATEMAKRKFRDIGVISGMVIQNAYGKQRNNKHLQSSSGIIFQVLEEHEPNNLLVKQAYTEVFNQQLEEPRLRAVFKRIEKSKILFIQSKAFTPLSFPIKVDSMRQTLSSEDLASRIQKMQAQVLRRKN